MFGNNHIPVGLIAGDIKRFGDLLKILVALAFPWMQDCI
jgi:hypothetical protein